MILRICVSSLLLLLAAGSYGVESYSQVSSSGSTAGSGPKVFKAMNMDLVYPRTFNSSENVVSTTEVQPSVEFVEPISPDADEQLTPEDNTSSEQMSSQPSSPEGHIPAASNYPPTFVFPSNNADESRESQTATGRAVDYRPVYPFSQLLTQNNNGYRPSLTTSRPVPRPITEHRVVYPSSYQAPRKPSQAEIDKLSGKGKFSDRFTPSEGVASSAFKLNQNRNRKPSNSRPVGQPSNKVSSYVPPEDLYAFPPNVDAKYPSPSDSKQAAPSDTVTSYLPPPAGPLDNGKFVGPVNPDLLPDNLKTTGDEAKNSSESGYTYNQPPNPKNLSEDGYIYQPPRTPLNAGLAQDMRAVEIGTPPPMMGMIDAPPPAPPMDDGMMDNSDMPADHDHHEIMGYEEDKEYPTPPPGYMVDHDHGHNDDHGPYFQGHDLDDHHHYHDIVYDDIHDHHHDEHIHHTEPPMTEPPPPPAPAPEQARVKKYSYFYIGRKLWYVPLYFTVWFTFYVLWLILKSISRHKVNLPNHYVTRRDISELSHREARAAIDKITLKVMDGIEKFKLKHIG